MADNQTRVIYKAIADFSSAARAARKLRREITELRREEARLNAQSIAGSAASTVAAGKHTKSREQLVGAVEKEAGSVRSSTVRFIENAKAAKENAKAVDDLGQAYNDISVPIDKFKKNADGTWRLVDRVKKSADGTWRSLGTGRRETNALGNAFTRLLTGATRLDRGLQKIGNWRPRLTPPFIALIPVIGGILALINPLVAGFGAVGAAALGFASSLGRVAAGAIGVIPALTTLMSVVAALKVAFGGIGGAFKAFGALKDATGGGGGGAAKAELTQAEELTRAQEAYARSIQDVAWAQEDLDDARKDYIKRLRELQKAVDRAAMSEARAAANAQLARENYANILADPGSTKGQKMDAKTGVEEAQADLQDVIDQNKQNQADLLEMQQKGIEGDREVIRATRALTDAINRQRDAELDLINTQRGLNKVTGGGASAASEYQKMLAKLSPSARRFVETLVSMSDAWTALKRNVQEAFFSEFVDDVERLRGLLPSIESLLSDTAGAVGRVASRFLRLITSPEWKSDLMLIGKQNVPIIENVGDALLSMLNVFKDLSIAAGPFLESLSKGLATGADNFERIVAAARADGSLASYLERVRESMSQWWRIVKNVGKALFNFSAAAGNFGQWLTDGLERITEGWLEASERAREEGSPFQQYLENIKPLLSEVQNLFADFFSWFARTASDPENIKAFTEIVTMIRTELGPALARILDILTKSGAGQDFVHAITAIVEAIATFLENGGIDGIKAFWNAVVGIADAFKTLVSVIPKPILSLLATTFGTLAALRFLGLTKLLGLFITLGRTGKLAGILDKIFFTFRGGGGGAHVAGAGGRVAGAAAGAGQAIKGGVQTAINFLAGLGGKVTASAGPKAGQGFNLLGSIAKGAGRGAGIGAIASIIGTIGGDLIASGAPEGSAGSGQRVGGGVLAGAASGAGIGALVGSVVPGVGTAIGAAAGGLVGGAVGLFTAPEEDRDKFFSDTAGMFEDFFTVNLPSFFDDMWTNLSTGWTDFFNGLGEGWDTFWGETWPQFWEDLVEGWNNFITVDLPNFIGTLAADIEHFFTVTLPEGWNTFWGETWPKFWDDLWAGWNQFFTVDLPTAWNTFWGTTWPKFWADLWAGWSNFFTVDLPNAWNTFWGTTWPKFWSDLWAGWSKFFTVDLPTAWNTFWGTTWPKFWGDLWAGWNKFFTVDLPNAWNTYWGETFPKFWSDFAAGIGGFFNDIATNWNNFWGGIFGNVSSAYEDRKAELNNKHNGGVIRRAGGGGVPGAGNSDTVPAMLTPGEFVVRRAIVNRVGLSNLVKFNAGVMSYAQMLQAAMRDQPSGSKGDKSGGGMSFFDGGGLVPGNDPFNPGNVPPGPDFGGFGGPGDGGMSFGDINIYNPAPEPASDSLPRTIRKVAYLGSKR